MKKYLNFVQRITKLGGLLLSIVALLPIFLLLVLIDVVGDAAGQEWIGPTATILFFAYLMGYIIYWFIKDKK